MLSERTILSSSGGALIGRIESLTASRRRAIPSGYTLRILSALRVRARERIGPPTARREPDELSLVEETGIGRESSFHNSFSFPRYS